MEDYRRIAAFIRAYEPEDEDVQREAQSALNHLRIVAGKLAYLAVTMDAKGD